MMRNLPLLIQEDPPLHLSIGVQRGVALVAQGPGSDPASPAYEIARSTAELAQRLSQSARPGEVLVGGSVYRAARLFWHFEPAAPIELPPSRTGPRLPDPQETPGGSGPQGQQGSLETLARARVYRLLGRRLPGEPISRPPASFGRDREISFLRAALAEAKARHRPVHVTVLGEAGMGKRALLSTFRAALLPTAHCFLRAAARHETVPLGLLSSLCRDLLGLTEHSGRAEVQLHLDAAIRLLGEDERRADLGQAAEDRHLRAQHLLSPLSLLLRDRGEISLPGPCENDCVQALHELLFCLRGERTLVLALEELQWADPASLVVLSALAQKWQGQPVLFVSTLRSREDLSPATQEWLLRTHRSALVEMHRLSESEQEAWILSHFEKGRAQKEALPLCRQIIEKAGGNPLYLREIFDSLTERGILKTVADGEGLYWACKDEPIAVPTTLEGIIAARLDRLPESQRQCLLLLALCQHMPIRPDRSLLCEVLGRSPDPDLSALQKRGLVTVLPEGRYHIPDTLVEDVARDALPEAERRTLKLRLLQRLSAGSGPGQTPTRTC
jgi:hypothetical protein